MPLKLGIQANFTASKPMRIRRKSIPASEEAEGSSSASRSSKYKASVYQSQQNVQQVSSAGSANTGNMGPTGNARMRPMSAKTTACSSSSAAGEVTSEQMPPQNLRVQNIRPVSAPRMREPGGAVGVLEQYHIMNRMKGMGATDEDGFIQNVDETDFIQNVDFSKQPYNIIRTRDSERKYSDVVSTVSGSRPQSSSSQRPTIGDVLVI